jgi:hypothetical protein
MAVVYAINGMKANGFVEVLIDESDLLRLSDRRYRFWKRSVYVYLYGRSDYRQIPLAHYIMGKPTPGSYWDHINGNPLDNRRRNLRQATPLQNSWNSKKKANGTDSVFKGVSKNGSGWMARIREKGRSLYLGTFSSEHHAARAYLLDVGDV